MRDWRSKDLLIKGVREEGWEKSESLMSTKATSGPAYVYLNRRTVDLAIYALTHSFSGSEGIS